MLLGSVDSQHPLPLQIIEEDLAGLPDPPGGRWIRRQRFRPSQALRGGGLVFGWLPLPAGLSYSWRGMVYI